MVKAQYRPIRQLVEGISPTWQERMGLSHYEIEHAFLDSMDGEPGDGSDFHTTAVCEVRWNYLEAKVKWYLPKAITKSPEDLEETLVHELCHVLLAPEQSLLDSKLDQIGADQQMSESESNLLQDLFYDRLELATEQVARAVFRAHGTAIPKAA